MAEMKKEKKMTREEAMELYKDLQRSMAQVMKNTAGMTDPNMEPKRAASKMTTKMAIPKNSTDKNSRSEFSSNIGMELPRRNLTKSSNYRLAAVTIGFCAVIKIVLSGLDASGVLSVEPAQAAVAPKVVTQFTNQEVEILKSLDSRRAELEERKVLIEEKEKELEGRDREFLTKLTELRELSTRLKNDRERNEKKQNTQLEQLANVYNAMNPVEAAKLLEQLDVTIAMSLLERMPEKRLGQILPLMSPNRALTITQMLSGRNQG